MRRSRDPAGPVMDLFPFLALFLCVLGVMSFLQVLLSIGGQTKTTYKAPEGQEGRVPFILLCGSDSLTLLHPQGTLGQLLADVDVAGGAAEADLARLLTIAERRTLPPLQVPLEAADQDADREDPPTLITQLAALFEEILLINRTARLYSVDYEEVVTISVRPGSVACVHDVREVVDSRDFFEVPVGLQAVSSNVEVVPYAR